MDDCYVEIDKKQIKQNIDSIIKKYGNYKYYIGVVKGNAYGHGFSIVNDMIESGINYLAVSTLKEALEVRNLTDCSILCLQPINIENLDLASSNNITITISNYNYYKEVLNQNLSLKVHLKLDTGMNRLGISKKEEVEEIYNELKQNKNIKLEGIYTHLATIGIEDEKWDNQITKFKELTNTIDLNSIEVVHIFSSNSLVIHPKLEFCNGVRLGIIMYGISPRKPSYNGIKGYLRKIKIKYKRRKLKLSCILNDYDINVNSAFHFYSKVIEIKDVRAGEYIGYGLKYKTEKNKKVAIVPVGYSDGLSLKNSGRYVRINGKNYKIVGSVNMKMLTILVDDTVRLNDQVEIIGNNIRYICGYVGVTPHSLLTMINREIPRIYK